MRKRLSVVTAAMIFACAISPAAVWAEEPPTTETPAVTSLAQNDLQTQINNLAKAAEGGSITLTGDVNLNNDGLSFDGLSSAGNSNIPASEWKTFTINADGHKIIMEGTGIEARFCNVIIQNCPELTIHASVTPGVLDSYHLGACFFGHATLTLDNCPKVTITNNQEEGQGGNGICVYNEGSLYFKNNTNVSISGYLAGTDDDHGASGIYMDKDSGNNDIMGEIVISDNSTLTISKCHHNGITANPANITVTGNSTLDVNHNNDGIVGKGGIGCYFGKLTVSDHSSVTSHDNSAMGMGFGIFVQGLDVDGTSEITTFNNGSFHHYGAPWNFDNWDGTGLAISGTAFLHSGAKVTAHDNWGIGVQVYRDADDADNYPGGTLTVESGATLSSIHNANYGLANAHNLNISSDAHVYLRENFDGGLDNYPLATTTVDVGADFVVSNNCGRGIKNGNSDKDEPATLILNSGVITENYNTKQMPVFPFLDGQGYGHYVDNGGGIYNEYGSVSLSSSAKVYNNHAGNSGDDLYNSDVAGNSFTITQLVPGAKWCVLDDDQKIIDDWYKDEAGKENRWSIDNAINNTDIKLPPSAALKAAHGKVAPTPSPSPTPDPTATPVPTNEPSPVPSASPVPSTPMPSAVPTAAPTAVPTEAPVQPTTAPVATAQPTATIPQTGDAAPLALFGGLTISSAAAFYFLRKRRKSE